MSLISENNKKELCIYDALKEVIDPELGINIIDLGLVYKIQYLDERILVEITLSTKACPMGNIILNDVEQAVQILFPESTVEVNLVWEPKWSPDFITPAGKVALGRV